MRLKFYQCLIALLIIPVFSYAQFQIGVGKAPYASGVCVNNSKAYVTGANYVAVYDLLSGSVSSFGTYGTGQAQFKSTGQSAVDANGKIYVTDEFNHKIQIFDKDGNFISQKGGVEGTGDGEFNRPVAIAIGNDGKIYVGERQNARIQVFDASFNFLYKFGSVGNGDGQFSDISSIVVDNNNQVYSSDMANNVIQVFDGNNNGTFVRKFGAGLINYSVGVAVDSETGSVYATTTDAVLEFDASGNYVGIFENGISSIRRIFFDNQARNLWVMQYDGVLLQYDLQANLLASHGTSLETDDDNLSAPRGVAGDSQGNIYATSSYSGITYIKKFSSNGTYLSKFRLDYSYGLAVDASDNLYVVGTGLRKYSSDGTLLASTAYNSIYIAVAPNGTVFISDSNNKNIKVFDSNLVLQGTWGTGDFLNAPERLVTDADNNLYVTTYAGAPTYRGQLKKYNSAGVLQWSVQASAGYFFGLAYDPAGYIYVVNESAINKYDLNGNFISSSGSDGLNLGQLYRSEYATYNNNKLLISESGSNRIMVIPPDAELGVALSGGSSIEAGSVSNIGNAELGASLTATFNIISQGLTPLQLTGNPKIVVTGTDAADFVIDETSLPNSFNGVASFKITFTPSSNGTKSASISIATNDADENPFTFTVQGTSKLDQTISGFNAIENKTYSAGSFDVSATASSGLSVSFYSTNTTVATVNGSTVSIVGVGTASIVASQAGDGTYNAAAPVIRTFVVTKAQLTAKANDFSRPYYDAASDLSITYTGFKSGEDENNSGITPPTIQTNVTQYSNAGNYPIELSGGNGGDHYNLVLENGTFTVTKKEFMVTIINPLPVYDGTPKSLIVEPDTFNIVVTYNGSTNAPINAGTYNALVTSDEVNYMFSPFYVQFTISKADQVITFPQIQDRNYSDVPLTLNASADSGLPVTYQVVSGPATIEGSTLSLIGIGTVTLKASQPGNDNYNAATEIEQSFVVNKADQVITFPQLQDRDFSLEPFTLDASSDSGLPVTFQIVSGPAFIEGTTLTLTGVGVITVKALQPGNENFNAATDVEQSFIVSKADQFITFDPITDKVYGDDAFDLFATGGDSSNPVIFEIVSGPATITGNTLTITGSGTVIVQASQAGNDNYNAAEVVEQSFIVNKADQVITFDPITDKVYGDDAFDLLANGGDSGNPVLFEIVSGSATITGSTLSITGAGIITVKASQEGNENFNIATSVEQTFNVDKASQIITIDPIEDKLNSDEAFTVSATSSAGLEVVFTITGPASISGNTITLNGETGFVTLEAYQPGNENYYESSASLTFEVKQDLVLSADDPSSAYLQTYPVPAHDYLIIRSRSMIKHITLFDMAGYAVLSTTPGNQEVKLDVNSLAQGAYILKVENKEGILKKKVFIK